MLFNSFSYLLFFPLAVILFFTLPQRFRWVFLLAVSYYFYMSWNAKYAMLILFTTASTFLCTYLMGRTDNNARKRIYLTITIFLNISILFLFKYVNFFNELIGTVLGWFNISYGVGKLNMPLPVGISFYTFIALGYAIDVFKGKVKHQKHFGKYALFVSFFPQLASGPITRAGSLLPQFDEEKKLNTERIAHGFTIILWGLFKKMVIADRLAVLVNTVYSAPDKYAGFQFIAAAVFYTFQIYCDFSGYSDMAIGSAKILGFDLMQNFKRPYLSMNIRDFWKRWHISLTSWFTEYVYIPLGGNRKNAYKNTMIVFLISGLWHGANLTFVLWGLLNGVYLVTGKVLSPYSKKILEIFKINPESIIYRTVRFFINFGLITFSWIIFRVNSINDLKLILGRLFSLNLSTQVFNGGITGLGLNKINLLLVFLCVMLLMAVEYYQEKRQSAAEVFLSLPYAVRSVCYVALALAILVFGMYGSGQAPQFIYFQF